MKEKGKGWPERQHGPETALSWTSGASPLKEGRGQRRPGPIRGSGTSRGLEGMRCPHILSGGRCLLGCRVAAGHPFGGGRRTRCA